MRKTRSLPKITNAIPKSQSHPPDIHPPSWGSRTNPPLHMHQQRAGWRPGTSEGILIWKAASQGAHVPSQSPALLCGLGTSRKSANKPQRSCHSRQTQDPGHCRDSGRFQGTLAPGSG